VFHLIWRAIFGFIIRSLQRIKGYQNSIWSGIFRGKARKKVKVALVINTEDQQNGAIAQLEL
jgi:hypothetical protein